MWLIHNPWAYQPYAGALEVLPTAKYHSGDLQIIDGESPYDLLGDHNG
jgi:hypothetical protein